ncbi:hypothetical protein HYD62_04175 [Mycoplasmopsis bovis]|nr:hypothetical protein HYD62_04175 [Mycoplasmopsis bovis]
MQETNSGQGRTNSDYKVQETNSGQGNKCRLKVQEQHKVQNTNKFLSVI